MIRSPKCNNAVSKQCLRGLVVENAVVERKREEEEKGDDSQFMKRS